MPRLQQDTFTVFVSHKSADKELADLVAEELCNLAPGLVECWVSGQALTAGVDWDREIKKQLAESHLLVLLFTTPQHTWDWCLYEVGLFVRFEVDDVVSVACLFDPNGSPPAPLNQVQCVRASSDDVARQLIRPFCTTTWKMSDTWQRGALAPHVSDDVVDAAAERIADGFRRTLAHSASGSSDDVYRYQPCHRIVLDLRGCSTGSPWDGIPAPGPGRRGGQRHDRLHTVAVPGARRQGGVDLGRPGRRGRRTQRAVASRPRHEFRAESESASLVAVHGGDGGVAARLRPTPHLSSGGLRGGAANRRRRARRGDDPADP